MNEIYDIIVAGAGVVGLTYADKLADSGLKILLYDHGTLGITKKSWLIPGKWLETVGYSQYATNKIDHFGIYSYLHNQSIIRKASPELACVTIDESRFFSDRLASIKSKGVEIAEHTEMLTWQDKGDYLELKSSKGVYKTKLLLDCTGVNSRFIKRGGNIKQQYYWPVYGLKFSGSNSPLNQSYLAAHIADYKGMKVFINDVPEGDSGYIPWMYLLTRTEIPLLELRNLYQEMLKTDFLKNLVYGHKVIGEKFGWIPAWDVKTRASNRILSLGDAGALAPWVSAMTFSFILHKLPEWLPSILSSINNNKLAEGDLNKIVTLSNQEEIFFDLSKLIFILMRNASSEEFEKLIKAYSEVDISIILKIILYFNASIDELVEFLKVCLKQFSLPALLKMLSRDSFSDELKIGTELVGDFLRSIN